MTEVQERFLRAVAERVPVERVVEVHLFPSLRQGQHESGVAIVAVEPEPPPTEARAAVRDESAAQGVAPGDAVSIGGSVARHAAPTDRHMIVTAHYRLTIKGPDRGRWELTVVADADAPLATLEAVVRGVRHRAGEGAEAERLSGEEYRAAILGVLVR